jgi:hypothetical protein
MRKIFLVLSFCVLFFIFCFSEERDIYESEIISKFPYKSLIFTQRHQMYWGEHLITQDTKIYMKNRKIRSENLNDDNSIKDITIIDVNEKIAYNYSPGKNSGMKVKINNKALESFYGSTKRLSANKKGKEKFNGENCDIYEYYNDVTIFNQTVRYKITEWRNKDGFVLKTMQEEMNESKKEKPSIIEVVKYQKNPKIDDNLFIPPKDVAFSDQSNLLSIFTSDSKTKTSKNISKQETNKNTDIAVKEDSINNTNNNEDKEENMEQKEENDIQNKIVDTVKEQAVDSVIKGIFGR